MKPHPFTALFDKLEPQLPLSKSRAQTLCMLISGVVSARTVNLSQVACERGGGALVASTYRRLQRFFQHVHLDRDWAAGLLAGMVGPKGLWTLCLDRTNWSVGKTEVNMLVLALSSRRHRIPLMWTQLGRKGNSGTPERIALMQRFIEAFGKSRIALLLADREFIGEDWFNWLIKHDIPFAIRLPQNLIAHDARGHDRPLYNCFVQRGSGTPERLTFFVAKDQLGLTLSVTAKRLPATKRCAAELLIVATNRPNLKALTAYRKRWAIESLFGDTKSRGLNIEDTRLTDSRKLDLLMAVVALATAWASRTAALIVGNHSLPRKKHGY